MTQISIFFKIVKRLQTSKLENDKVDELTITTIGLVLILLARAAYRRVFEVSDRLDRAGDTQAIWKGENFGLQINALASVLTFI